MKLGQTASRALSVLAAFLFLANRVTALHRSRPVRTMASNRTELAQDAR